MKTCRETIQPNVNLISRVKRLPYQIVVKSLPHLVALPHLSYSCHSKHDGHQRGEESSPIIVLLLGMNDSILRRNRFFVIANLVGVLSLLVTGSLSFSLGILSRCRSHDYFDTKGTIYSRRGRILLRAPPPFFSKIDNDSTHHDNGDQISQHGTVLSPPPTPSGDEQARRIVPVNIPLDILYEDEDMLAIYKPAGMPVQYSQGSAENAVVFYLKNGSNSNHAKDDNRNEMPASSSWPWKSPWSFEGMVHRLDKGTSGILLVAKHPHASRTLRLAFEQRQVQKTYLAISEGFPTLPNNNNTNNAIGNMTCTMAKVAVKETFAGQIAEEVPTLQQKNLSKAIKICGKNHMRALQLLHEAEPDLLSPSCYSAAISVCRRAGERDLAVSLFDSMFLPNATGIMPNTLSFKTILSLCAAVDPPLSNKALDLVYTKMPQCGFLPYQQPHCVSAAIAACGRDHRLQDALALLDEVEKGGSPVESCRRAAIQACKRCGNHSMAQILLDGLLTFVSNSSHPEKKSAPIHKMGEPILVNVPIGKVGPRRMGVTCNRDAREARSIVTPLAHNDINGRTYHRITIESGRTHQIRVHMQHLGCPLAGDTVYGTNQKGKHRPMLHAFELIVPHPTTAKPIYLYCPPPKDFEAMAVDIMGEEYYDTAKYGLAQLENETVTEQQMMSLRRPPTQPFEQRYSPRYGHGNDQSLQNTEGPLGLSTSDGTHTSISNPYQVTSISKVIEQYRHLLEGKHPSKRVCINGAVREIKETSPRLVFMRVFDEESLEVMEVLLRQRDGFLSVEEIEQITRAAKQSDAILTFRGFPEILSFFDGPSFFPHLRPTPKAPICLHVVSAVAQLGRDQIILNIPERQQETISSDESMRSLTNRMPPLSSQQGPARGNRGRGGGGNRDRGGAFATWAIDTFDLVQCNEENILDIAGGSGQLAFQFGIRRGFNITVIDPRPLRLASDQQRTLDYHRRTGLRQLPDGRDLSLPPSDFGHHFARAEKHPRAELNFDRTWLVGGEARVRHLAQWFDTDFRCRRVWQNATLVLGMHPDQATEDLVDLALADDKPFAYVRRS
eukprot:scaffold45428_cov176-Amphora_coffeaeformis.AAC.4